MELGKLPPQAIDVEQAVLGTVLSNPSAMGELIGILEPGHFYKESHQNIFAAMQTLFNSSNPVDLVTVGQELRRKGMLEFAGGNLYLIDLSMKSVSTSVSYHAFLLKEKAVKRQYINHCGEILQMAYREETDTFELVQHAERTILSVSTTLNAHKVVTWENQVRQVLQYHQLIHGKGGLTGIPSAFRKLTEISPFEPGRLYVVAARPAMGKSLYLTNEEVSMLYQGLSVAEFNYEMTTQQSTDRKLACITGIKHELIKTGAYLNEPSLVTTMLHRAGELAGLKFHCYDDSSITFGRLASICRKLKASPDGLDAVCIDYLQIMPLDDTKGKGGTRTERIGEISGGLKKLAKELDIPIIVLSQLSKEVDKRPGSKIPNLSDLRDSGAIEQDADTVYFIYRPFYYGITHDKKGTTTNDLMQVHVAKNRDGALGVANLQYLPAYSQITDFPDIMLMQIEMD